MDTKYERKSSKILLFFRIISIIVIILCLIYIIHWYLENRKNANMIKDLTENAVIETIYIDVRDPDVEEGEEPKVDQIPVYELDFEKLFAVNNNTVGWLKVPNTTIDYPVAQHTDNSFYLTHSFDKSKNSAGWIFADYRNKFDGTDKNIIIYGHNRMDSSMFATLRNTQNANWYNNPTNKYITFTSPSGTHVYQVFSVYTIKSETYYLSTDFANDEDFLTFLNEMRKRSVHDFGVNLTATDSIITLSTCDASGKSRVILHAKQIQ